MAKASGGAGRSSSSRGSLPYVSSPEGLVGWSSKSQAYFVDPRNRIIDVRQMANGKTSLHIDVAEDVLRANARQVGINPSEVGTGMLVGIGAMDQLHRSGFVSVRVYSAGWKGAVVAVSADKSARGIQAARILAKRGFFQSGMVDDVEVSWNSGPRYGASSERYSVEELLQ